ncbi:DUF4111 domain-containing protein [Actinomadura spongiicola]|uniref:DUF4111 domain-containing protein n=1 Tax=Actinomadura spongiicola TaxID=2303421 RepID=A0A372GIG8_9ACTN|nr:aminoglycoside adenylyltransferase domain-containing protein [Actinomadura spongiicola]RFS85147.1 DUF4111 domain-containing protein [Actinomadura spongiicola]
MERTARRYLGVADRLLPGRISGFHLVGSAALGSWRPGRSDIDFVAVVAGRLTDGDVRRLRALHVVGNAEALGRAVLRARPAVPGTMNGVFVAADDLGEPVTAIRPLASHSGPSFHWGRAFDVNPVTWKLLREGAVTLRGPAPGELPLDPEPERLRAWTREQLRGHWRSFADRTLSPRPPRKRLQPPERVVLASLLGPPRLHRTVATGEIISKEAAGEYALDVFAPRWHALVRDALAHRRGDPVPAVSPRSAGEFMLEVIDDVG